MASSLNKLAVACVLFSVCSFMLLQHEERGGVAAWGSDGHFLVCSVAQTMFTSNTLEVVNSLLPIQGGDLASWCSWADEIKQQYPWSSPLHFINTPQVCTYSYERDCIYEGIEGVCAAGAINNYTSQLTTYGSSKIPEYNLTEALLFLAHIVGDIHQPMHVSFSDDRGGNNILVHWFDEETNLHWVWDGEIIETALTTLYDSNLQAFQENILKNISDIDVEQWGSCQNNMLACPDIYAKESLSAACNWGYKDVSNGSYLGESYFESRLPIIEERIAHGGVRLASILNNLFQNYSSDHPLVQ